MADANPTTPRDDREPQDKSQREPGEWALIANAHMNSAVDEFLNAFSKVDLPPDLQAALLRLLTDVAKLVGVLEWLGEGLVVLPEDSSQ